MKISNSKNIMLGLLGLAVAGNQAFAYTQNTGNVTPDFLRITVTSATLIKADNSEIQVFSSSIPTEFTRSGAAFAAVPLTPISVPVGRYIGMRLGFLDAYEVKLTGAKYIGLTGTTTNGDPLYTPVAVANAKDAGSVSTTVSATSQYVTLASVSQCGTTCSSTTYFARPACVAGSASACPSTDDFVGGDGTTLPNLNVLIDMYQSIQVDGSDKSLSRGAVYPFVMIGQPGAAIHLQSFTGNSNGTRNVSILFSPDKRVQSVATWGGGGDGSTAVGPTGGSWVTATAGANVNQYGPSMFSDFNATTGVLKFPMGNCPTGTCTSSGLAILTGILQAPGTSVAFTCEADTTGALGYTYTGGDCSSVTTGNMKVARVIDPNNVLGVTCTKVAGVCAATSAQITGTTDADGYL